MKKKRIPESKPKLTVKAFALIDGKELLSWPDRTGLEQHEVFTSADDATKAQGAWMSAGVAAAVVKCEITFTKPD